MMHPPSWFPLEFSCLGTISRGVGDRVNWQDNVFWKPVWHMPKKSTTIRHTCFRKLLSIDNYSHGVSVLKFWSKLDRPRYCAEICWISCSAHGLPSLRGSSLSSSSLVMSGSVSHCHQVAVVSPAPGPAHHHPHSHCHHQIAHLPPVHFPHPARGGLLRCRWIWGWGLLNWRGATVEIVTRGSGQRWCADWITLQRDNWDNLACICSIFCWYLNLDRVCLNLGGSRRCLGLCSCFLGRWWSVGFWNLIWCCAGTAPQASTCWSCCWLSGWVGFAAFKVPLLAAGTVGADSGVLVSDPLPTLDTVPDDLLRPPLFFLPVLPFFFSFFPLIPGPFFLTSPVALVLWCCHGCCHGGLWGSHLNQWMWRLQQHHFVLVSLSTLLKPGQKESGFDGSSPWGSSR